MSRVGRGVRFEKDCGSHLLLVSFRNFLSVSFLMISGMGIVIQRLPVLILRVGPLSFLFPLMITALLLELILFIYTPKNLALWALALVIRVFSIDSSNFRVIKNSFIESLRLEASLLDPHRPINQSSAYLTYWKFGPLLGFGIRDLTSLLDFNSIRTSFRTVEIFTWFLWGFLRRFFSLLYLALILLVNLRYSTFSV